MTLYPKLQSFINQLSSREIPDERKQVLQPLIAYIQEKQDAGKQARLNFICTHNSRRSQFSQIWAQLAADYHGVDAECFSGGVEVTAFNERAVASIQRAGFRITQAGTDNPRYFLFSSDDADPIVAFSKLYDEMGSNPYAAVMTCSHADENCPFIPAAEVRIPVRYEDPKQFDNTPGEADRYDERSLQIASEMFHVFSNVKVYS
jgi:arsenate reductase (thioredoxin)